MLRLVQLVDKANGYVYVERMQRDLEAAGATRLRRGDLLGAAAARAMSGYVASADMTGSEYLHDVTERYTSQFGEDRGGS